jgi:nucleoside-diphosphate-sugar epimerase
MKVLVTGSSGHLGEALVRKLKDLDFDVISVDILNSPFTTHVGSIIDRHFVNKCMKGVETVFHAATLHKPHVVTHSFHRFVDTNITGTINLLHEAHAMGVKRFICTSTTSVFGDALVPPLSAPAAWITEEVVPVPKNIYGVTKSAAEDICHLFHRNNGLSCVVLRTSRFFQEEDDNRLVRERFSDANLKANEFLFRRIDIEDAVNAHLLAAECAENIGFGKYIISATAPFTQNDLTELRDNAPSVVKRLFNEYEEIYRRLEWKMFQSIDRVYVNEKAQKELNWKPKYDFRYILSQLSLGKNFQSPLTELVGSKGYHNETFADGPYPVN